MYNKAFLFLICFFSFLHPAAAEMFKCKDSNGTIVFSDRKCSDNAEKVEVKTPMPASNVIDSRGNSYSVPSTPGVSSVKPGGDSNRSGNPHVRRSLHKDEVHTTSDTQGQPGR